MSISILGFWAIICQVDIEDTTLEHCGSGSCPGHVGGRVACGPVWGGWRASLVVLGAQFAKFWTAIKRQVSSMGQLEDRPSTGRPRITTPRQDRFIRIRHFRNRFFPASRTCLLYGRGHTPASRVRPHSLPPPERWDIEL